MSYGIEVKNAAGEDIFFGPLLYIKEELTTAVYSNIGTTTFRPIPSRSAADPLNGWNSWFRWDTSAMSSSTYDHYIFDGVFNDPGDGTSSKVPGPYFSSGDLCFVEIPSGGIYEMSHVNNTLPEYTAGGFFHMATIDGASPVNAMICSTDYGVATSGNYGMQVFNEAGDLTFDSRFKYPQIKEHKYIAASVFLDILTNDTVHDITLTHSTPNAKICCPHWFHGQWEDNGETARVLLRQINNTTLRLSRIQDAGFTSGTFASRYTHDTPLIIAS
jgi:hypothetical protein